MEIEEILTGTIYRVGDVPFGSELTPGEEVLCEEITDGKLSVVKKGNFNRYTCDPRWLVPGEEPYNCVYRRMQCMSGISGGDRVKVTRGATEGERGWKGTWYPWMASLVGNVYDVERLADAYGVSICVPSDELGFALVPYFSLEKVGIGG